MLRREGRNFPVRHTCRRPSPGFSQAILPPEGVDRSKVDSALADVTGAWVPEDRDFCGEWRLLYANNGTARRLPPPLRHLGMILRVPPAPQTHDMPAFFRAASLLPQVVTRAVATSASFLPRLSVSDVRQVIQKSPNVPAPALETTNEAVLGLRRDQQRNPQNLPAAVTFPWI